jgi:fibronectin-binding autotransporter adhesin
MATRIQVRRDTAANWTTSGTTVLAAGEIGFETDTLLFKIGDGSQQWQNLEYAGGTEPIRNNPSGTSVTDLNAAALRNNGNGKYLISGADIVANEPSGLTTATDGQLMVTVAKFDYTGTSAANERFLMTLQTLTTNKWFTRVWSGSAWSSWVEVIQTPFTGNLTLSGDIAVNGGDITTTSATGNVFETTATTVTLGRAATTVCIGDNTTAAQQIDIGAGATVAGATKTINIGTNGVATSTTNVNIGGSLGNGTVAVAKNMTVGGTFAVTGQTTLTDDLAVNGGDITTTSTGTATVFNANATTLNVGQAATTVSIGATTGTATIRNATTAITGAATVGQTLAVTGNTTLTGDLAVNGGDITTNQTTASVFNATATTLNVGGAATAINVGTGAGTVTVAGDLAVNGGDITTTSTGTATVFNANATTLNVGQAATTVSIGATTGTATIRNATTAITGNATVGGSATVSTTLGVTGNTTLTGDLAVNGGDITTTSATGNVFETTATTVTLGRSVPTVCIADNVTAAQTIDIGTGATVSGATKTINIGTGGAAGSTTNVNIGDADGGTVSIARDLAVDTNVLKVDATNNRVGINVTSPTQALDVFGNLLVSGTVNTFTLASMSGETLTDYPKSGGTSRVGSFALLATSEGASGWGGNQSTNGQFVSGVTSASGTGPAFGGQTTVHVVISGGVTWTIVSGRIRPSAGTWTLAAFGTSSTTGQTGGCIAFAVRTA